MPAAFVPTASAIGGCLEDPDLCTHTENVSYTLHVTAPSSGAITSTPSGISCGVTCNKTLTAHRECTNLNVCGAWVYDVGAVTLTTSGGPAGYVADWTGCDSTNASNQCLLDGTEPANVSITWRDNTPPNKPTLNLPTKVGTSTQFTAVATDNSGAVVAYHWMVDNIDAGLSLTPYRSLGGGLAEGSHIVTVRARDAAGFESDATSKTTVLDKTVRLSVGELPAWSNAGAPSLTFASPDSDIPAGGFSCRIDAGAWGTCTSPYQPAQLTEGTHHYTVSVTDDVGNVASAQRTVIIDRTSPTASFTAGGLQEGAAAAVSTLDVTFAIADNSTFVVANCAVDTGASIPCSNANHHLMTGVSNGAHTLTVTAFDPAGNTFSITRHFSVAVPAPTHGTTAPTGTVVPHAHAAASNKVVMTVRSKKSRAFTALTKLTFKKLPKAAHLTVTCTKKRCAKLRLVLKKGSTLSVTKLAKRKLAAGTKVKIVVAAKGFRTVTYSITIRARKAPLIKRVSA
jgi:hypothetical protein